MMITGMMRAKNASRWIEESLVSMLSVCNNVFVLDDHSLDDTAAIAGDIPDVFVVNSPFMKFNEARDKTFLLAEVRRRTSPDWILFIDADETLINPTAVVAANIASGRGIAYRLRVLFLWDRPDQVRVDGIYGDFWRASLFDNRHTNGVWVQRDPDGPNLHCDNVPSELSAGAVRSNPPILLKHYGPMLREDRIAKYEFYRQLDPRPAAEDDYRHAVQGDLPEFPADAVYRYGGPLKLIPLDQI